VRRLDRYLLGEFLIPLGFCLGGFLVFWIAFDLFGELHHLQDKKLHGLDVAELYVFKTPEFLILVLPVALLLGLLYALTNHARHNEITAIRAAGVSLWRLCLPYMAVGVMASLALFALEEFGVPRTSAIVEEILQRRVGPSLSPEQRQWVRNLDFQNARDDRYWHIGTYNQQSGEMRNLMVKWSSADGTRWQLFAERAAFTNGCWTFFKAREFRFGMETNTTSSSHRQIAALIMPSFSETPRMIKSEILVADRLSLRNTRQADIPVSEILNYESLHPNPDPGVRAWLSTKLHGRLAGPWTCLVVVLIAVPFAVPSGRRNVFVGVAASIFICFTFFILQQVGFAFGSAGYVPAWVGGWLPNLIFAATGLVLMARVR